MALQTTGLEFFYLSVDFFENDKILLVEQELGSRATLLVLRLLARIYHKGYFAVGERMSVCFYPQIARRLYGRLCTASGGCTIGTWLFSKVQYENLEFLLRKAYRAIILRRHNDGSV